MINEEKEDKRQKEELCLCKNLETLTWQVGKKQQRNGIGNHFPR